jgi:hypothetical protein
VTCQDVMSQFGKCSIFSEGPAITDPGDDRLTTNMRKRAWKSRSLSLAGKERTVDSKLATVPVVRGPNDENQTNHETSLQLVALTACTGKLRSHLDSFLTEPSDAALFLSRKTI